MRVAADELEALGPRHVLDAGAPGLVLDLGVEENVEEEVSQLVFDIVRAAAAERLLKLPGLFPQETDQGAVGLLAVPRAAPRPAQPRDQDGQAVELAHGASALDLLRELLRSIPW